jgi:hypothetical protein
MTHFLFFKINLIRMVLIKLVKFDMVTPILTCRKFIMMNETFGFEIPDKTRSVFFFRY